MKNCLPSNAQWGKKEAGHTKIASTQFLYNYAKKISIPIDKSWQGNKNNQGVWVVGIRLLFLLFLISCNFVFTINISAHPPSKISHIFIYLFCFIPTAPPPSQSKALLFHAWITYPNFSSFNLSRLQMQQDCLSPTFITSFT